MAFTVSSPGKVILFGEHAVVHGCPAIAASVSLHTFVTVEESKSQYVELDFPDINLAVGWSYEDFIAASGNNSLDSGKVQTELDEELLKHAKFIAETTISESNTFSRVAATAFLYLYLSIYFRKPQGVDAQQSQKCNLKFITSGTLPIGAGLGSSASFSVCIAAALLKASGQISATTSHDEAMDLISKWSFLGECCIHGKPSGIDNIVATRGGAVYFQRSQDPALPPLIKPYENMPELQLILTDTLVSRQTSALVARVTSLKDRWPSVFEPLLQAFKAIVEQANSLLSETVHPQEFAQKISELVDINHGLLSTVNVSHPSLEKVRETSRELGIGSTKLTGAGGGGCAITITSANAAHGTEIERFREKLGQEFRVFVTKLGGPGVGWADDVASSPDKQEKLEWHYW